jgi:hypothetical protein
VGRQWLAAITRLTGSCGRRRPTARMFALAGGGGFDDRRPVSGLSIVGFASLSIAWWRSGARRRPGLPRDTNGERIVHERIVAVRVLLQADEEQGGPGKRAEGARCEPDEVAAGGAGSDNRDATREPGHRVPELERIENGFHGGKSAVIVAARQPDRRGGQCCTSRRSARRR